MNRTKTTSQLFDMSPQEAVKVIMNDPSGEQLSPFDVSLDRIRKDGKNGVVTLRGRQILLGDTAPAPIEGSKIEQAAVLRRLNGLQEVRFEKK